MKRLASGLGSVVFLAGLTACGDEGGAAEPDDGGRVYADTGPPSRDSGSPRDSGPSTMDGGSDGGSPLVACDPFTADSCAKGEKCSVVVVELADEEVVVRFDCVPEKVGVRGEGVPCRRGVAVPGRTAHTTDDCRQGLFCWRNPGTTFAACQRLCGPDTVDCERVEYCNFVNEAPPFGTCATATGCDPVFNSGCPMGQSCYSLSNTVGDRVSSCFPFVAEDGGTGAPGEPCTFINNCRGGAQCLPEYFPDGGLGDVFECRDLCVPALDGGVPMDAGAGSPGPGCDPPGRCVAIPLEDGREYLTPSPVGGCY
jgi:hypothetical protein